MAGGKKDQCGSCHANFTKTQRGAQCKVCQLWFHSLCVGVSDAELKAIKEFKHLGFVCSSCKDNPPTDDERSLRDEITILNNKFDAFMKKSDEERSSIKQTFADVVADFKTDLSACINELKSDVIDCSKLVRHVESSTNVKILQLEVENNALHRRLNRADLIISGLPVGLSNLASPVIELGSFYNVPISLHDINHVCYMHNKKCILVKFNSVLKRDEIMRAYFKTVKTRSLLVTNLVKLNDVDGSNVINAANLQNDTNQSADSALRIDKRVFLNDRHSPAAGKLNALCRKLLKDKVILKFKVLDADKPKAKLTKSDGNELLVDIDDCAALFRENIAA